MASITLGGTPAHTNGSLPENGSKAPSFELSKGDMSTAKLSDYEGKKVVLNIFPSVDTGVCAASVRHFNEAASKFDNTKVLCVSRDLPFAQGRFCGAEGIENVEMLSDFKTGQFGKDYGLEITDGAFGGLHSRVIIVLNEKGEVVYSEQVPEIGDAPNFEAAEKVLKEI